MATNCPQNNVLKTEEYINGTDRFCIDYSEGITTENLDETSLKEVHQLITDAKFGKFLKVWEVLDEKPHYINCIPEVRPFGVLHQAAFLRKKAAVIKILSYPKCNPFIETNQDADNKFGKGRTADELNVSQELKCIILEAQQKHVLKLGTSKHLRDNGDYHTEDKDAIDSIAKYVEENDWEKVLDTLKCSPHLINVLLPNTGLTVLHQVVINDNLDLVTQMLDYPASNPYVETVESESHRYGPANTPGDLAANNPKIFDVIDEKKNEMVRNYLSLPKSVLPWQSGANFVAFFSSVLEDYQNILCPKGMLEVNQDFHFIIKQVFLHINNGANWKLAKREVAYQIRNFDVEYSNLLENEKPVDGKKDFYSKLIQIYTREDRKLIYGRLNILFYENFLLEKGKISNTNLVFGTYALVLNALLIHWDELESYHGYTYRGVLLEPSVQAELVDGYEFSFLNFLSCSVKEESIFKNVDCVLRIDNSTVCPWSPKLIGKYAAIPEQGEYLYPCGARFKVIPSDSRNYINLKLIAPQ